MENKLYLVSTPIGNYDDITLRGLKVLKEVDFIICEEYKPASKLLRHYQIKNELIQLNEHNEEENTPEVINMLKQGKSAALISDCGTPLFSDPGNFLLPMAIKAGITIVPVPGASSLLPALIGSGFNTTSFYYYGWLSPKKEIRKKELTSLKSVKELLVIMETPYRLKALLTDVAKVFGKNAQISIGFKLTQEGEKFFRGTVFDILKTIEANPVKGEFVLLLENRDKIRNRL